MMRNCLRQLEAKLKAYGCCCRPLLEGRHGGRNVEGGVAFDNAKAATVIGEGRSGHLR